MKLPVPVRPAVKRMRPYHPPLEGRTRKLRLDFNENTLACLPSVKRALVTLPGDVIAAYPEYEAARQRLARFFRVRRDELILTNGTDDALRLVLDTFAERGSRVLLTEPTFAMYRFYAELADTQIVALRYGKNMEFPLDSALRAFRARPCVFFLANPNNPTGTLVGKCDLEHLLRAAARTLVVVDEAYADFSRLTILPWIRRYPNLVVTRTFSKAAGLAGLRLGCLFAHRSLISVLRKAHSPYPVNSAALAAAKAAVQDARSLRRYVNEVSESKQELCRALDRLAIRHFPGAGNFVLVDFARRAPQILRRLQQQGILLRDRRRDFGRVGYVRITVGTPAQTRRLTRALKHLWKS